jgi:hypothetical protein
MTARVTRAIIATAIALLCTATTLRAKDPVPEERISAVVLAGGSQTDFTDPSFDRANTAIDIMDALKKSKVVRVVTSEADAVLVIEVLSYVQNSVTPFGAVHARLTAGGTFTTELDGAGPRNGMAPNFRAAAKSIAAQVEVWVKSNLQKLRTMQPAWHPPTP